MSIDVSCSFLVRTKTLQIVANIAKIGQQSFLSLILSCFTSCVMCREPIEVSHVSYDLTCIKFHEGSIYKDVLDVDEDLDTKGALFPLQFVRWGMKRNCEESSRLSQV